MIIETVGGLLATRRFPSRFRCLYWPQAMLEAPGQRFCQDDPDTLVEQPARAVPQPRTQVRADAGPIPLAGAGKYFAHVLARQEAFQPRPAGGRRRAL